MGRRDWFLIALIVFLRFDFAQGTVQDQQISMGLMPVTEIHLEAEWVTVFSTVPVDLVCSKTYVYLSPGAHRVRKNIFPKPYEFTTRPHDFIFCLVERTKKITGAIEVLEYNENGVFSKGFKEATVFYSENIFLNYYPFSK
jgi:hypothetical protein